MRLVLILIQIQLTMQEIDMYTKGGEVVRQMCCGSEGSAILRTLRTYFPECTE